MDSIWHYDSPLGRMWMAGDGKSLTGLWFERQQFAPAPASAGDASVRWLPVFDETCRWLECYFGGYMPDYTPPLALQGTPFRLAVWEILQEIPYGATMTYGAIAARLAADRGRGRMSAQAVGGAVGHNPIALIIPCHRVIGADGSLTGYAAGLDRKEWLLRWESENHF
ncbi:MAG: methylated-DNA--[Bacteroidales bacterium]|nr:methylated-DNA--[protein]-cysteine S-methyltransferase [Bacteroidales bacterium]